MVITQKIIATGRLFTTNIAELQSLEPVQERELYLEYSRVADHLSAHRRSAHARNAVADVEREHLMVLAPSRLNQEQWNLAKVSIQRDEVQSVLQCNRRDPDIIARNGAAHFSQIHINLRISQCSLLGYVQDADRGLTQELSQLCDVLRVAIAGAESAVQLAQHNRRQCNGFRPPNYLGNCLMCPPQFRVSRCVERYVHSKGSQSIGSTLRISAKAALNSSASASDHVPMKSSKSEFLASFGLGSDACNNRSVALLRLIPSRWLVSRIAFSTSGGRFLREIVMNSV